VPHPNLKPGLRGDVIGWNASTARRQKLWLWTVDESALTGIGVAVTLTVGECPPDAATWRRMRDAWLKRIGRKFPVLRVHWVTEWQRRMVPHTHAAVYLDLPVVSIITQGQLAVEWLLVCDAFGLPASLSSQDVKLIAPGGGWSKYMSKHAARGANHYQRTGHPKSWNKTGRMWGHTGDWPTVEPTELKITHQQFYRIRRIMRAWAIADARKTSDWGRVAFLRRSAGHERTRQKSQYQAVSEWIPESATLRLVDYLERSTGEPWGLPTAEAPIR
jgi:hypothetical protein